jgi:hypothetical protein
MSTISHVNAEAVNLLLVFVGNGTLAALICMGWGGNKPERGPQYRQTLKAEQEC